MSKSLDLTGKKFNRLTVICRCDDYVSPKGKTIVRWLCKCDCGNETKVATSSLMNNRTKSCGCLNRENTIKRNLTHNFSKTRLYSIYHNMKARCYNAKNPYYYNYGGRGISICDEWLNDFSFFYNWAVNHGYKDTLFIDRINNNGIYEPDNCRWVTAKENSNNKRNNIYIVYNGETHTMSQWAEILQMSASTLRNRMYRNLTFEEAINL